MSRRGENIYKRKDGRWEGRYIKERINGKIKYGYVFARSYNEVRIKLTIQKADQFPGNIKLPEITSGFPGTIQFSDIAAEWFQSKEAQWKQSSIVKYSNTLNSYILPFLGERYIHEISRDELVQYISLLLTTGGIKKCGLSTKTVTGIMSMVKNIFLYAADVKGIAVANVCGITIKQSQKPMRILSLQEQQKLSHYLCRELTNCNLGILLCLYTGLRIGEICALRWSDISLDEQYIHIHQTMQRIQTKDDEKSKTSVVILTPKSSCSIRRVPIPDNLLYLMTEFQAPENAFLLTGKEKKYMEPRTLENHFKTIINLCSIDKANFHALRHTFATRCVELGFDVKSLSEILGHASVNITLNRYVHPSMELKKKNMNMLSEIFSVS